METSTDMLREYLKGSGAACTVTLLLFIFYTIILGEVQLFPNLAFLLAVCTYLGSIVGVLLLKLVEPYQYHILYPILGTFFFGFLGIFYGVSIIYAYQLDGFFVVVTMASSMSFFVSQFVQAQTIAWIMAGSGPFFLAAIMFSNQLAHSLGQ